MRFTFPLGFTQANFAFFGVEVAVLLISTSSKAAESCVRMLRILSLAAKPSSFSSSVTLLTGAAWNSLMDLSSFSRSGYDHAA